VPDAHEGIPLTASDTLVPKAGERFEGVNTIVGVTAATVTDGKVVLLTVATL
jgi:hypothetical protein